MKMAIESDEDLQAMYSRGDITFWCDGAVQEASAAPGKE